MNYYEHHLGDWAAATGHLSWDEDMAYTRLLRAYYHHEQAIAEGQQYRLAKASTPAQRKAVDQVLSEFFELREGRYHQKRADAEIAKYRESEPDREAKRENERERQRRARERRKQLFDVLREHGVVPAYDAPMSELQRLALLVESRNQPRDVTQSVTRDVTATHTPSTRHQTNTPLPPEGFDEFWNAYPSKVGKTAALKAFAKIRPSQDLTRRMLDAIETQKASPKWTKNGGEFIPNPATWLNQGRWDDGEGEQRSGLQLVGAI